MRPGSEISENRVTARAGDVKPAAQAVPRRRSFGRQRTEDLPRLAADPFHRLQEERALGLEGGDPVEVGPIAARTGSMRPREA